MGFLTRWGWQVEPSGIDLTTSIAAAAVQALTTAAGGAGTAVGQAVGDLVRTRLATVEPGRSALAAVVAAPEDPAAGEELRRSLSVVLAEDPRFLTSLVGALTAAPQTVTGSMVLGHSVVRDSNLSLGDQSITNNHRSYGWLTAVAVLVAVVLIGLAAYGAVRVLDGDEPSSGSLPGGPALSPGDAQGAEVTVVADRELATLIMPDLDSVPTGWRLDEGSPADGHCPPGCEDPLQSVQMAYHTGDGDWVWMEVSTFGGAEDATTGYGALRTRLDDVAEQWKNELYAQEENATPEDARSAQTPMSLQAIDADEYAAVRWSVDPIYMIGSQTSASGAEAIIRAGTVVVDVSVMKNWSGNMESNEVLLAAVAKAVVARAWQAQHGETPTALVEPV